MWVPAKQKKKTSAPQRVYHAINRGLQKRLQVSVKVKATRRMKISEEYGLVRKAVLILWELNS